MHLYGLIKTHKPVISVKLIISTLGTATYNVPNYFVCLLSPLVGSIWNFNVINSKDLVKKLDTTVLIYGFQLVSFDATSLCICVSIRELLVYLADELSKLNFYIKSEKILDLIR